MFTTHRFLLMMFLLLPLSVWSQEDIRIGKQYSVYSSSLQEKRTYWVHLPDNYEENKNQHYPVIYLLDGEDFFHAMVGIRQTLSTTKGKHIPPCIIIGIISGDRTRDFTPTASTIGRDGKQTLNAIPQGGGADLFYHFLIKELRTRIDSSYRTNGRNILIGHSYGGLFTLNVFLHYTESFDTYLAIDPSLWWDNGRLAKEAISLIKRKDFSQTNLYIGIASKKRNDRTDIHLATIRHFLHVLSEIHGLHFYHKSFPDENHGSVKIPGLYDGIKQLFAR